MTTANSQIQRFRFCFWSTHRTLHSSLLRPNPPTHTRLCRLARDVPFPPAVSPSWFLTQIDRKPIRTFPINGKTTKQILRRRDDARGIRRSHARCGSRAVRGRRQCLSIHLSTTFPVTPRSTDSIINLARPTTASSNTTCTSTPPPSVHQRV